MRTLSGISEIFEAVAATSREWLDPAYPARRLAIQRTLDCDNSFTEEAICHAIDWSLSSVSVASLASWLAGRTAASVRDVAVLNAGNVPMVGYQDFLAVLCTGHSYAGVLSSKSPFLMPGFADSVRERLPTLRARFDTLGPALATSQKLVATGADATMAHVRRLARQAGIMPEDMLVRGTRFSVAVLTGEESRVEAHGLAEDMLLHDGRGCLNASILFVPHEWSSDPLVQAIEAVRRHFPAHPKTLRSIRQQRRFFAATGVPCLELNGVLLIEGDPVPRQAGVVVVSRYRSLEEAGEWIKQNSGVLQAVITSADAAAPRHGVSIIRPGTAQRPELGWLQDGRDVVEFLTT